MLNKITIALLFILLPLVSFAEEFQLTADQESEIEVIDAMYKQYKTIKARFIQVDSLGNRAQGWFVIQKPGKARIEYENIPIRLIANNNSIMMQDLKLKQKSFIPAKSFPFSYLLEKDTSFLHKGISVSNFIAHEEYYEISLANAENPGLGYITLFLTKEKAEIMKWIVFDAKGVTTEIYLVDAEFKDANIKNQTIFNVQTTRDIDYAKIN